jgi:hypothetical protein
MSASFVVIACKMEEPVYEQSLQFFVKSESIFCRLPLCFVEVDYDIAQQTDAI